MSIPAIYIQNCSKRFRKKLAVDQLTLSVTPGQVYGLVGDNGAGKTTTIKMLLGLLKPTDGRVEVLGLDPIKNDIEMKKRIGYMSEEREMYEWMTVKEIIWFVAQFYETWDDTYAADLLQKMDLPENEKIKNLSRGMKAKVALLLALGHQPELVILDEPSSGLDPIVRREILEHIITLIQEEGRTVFFSSHLLDEVERVSDRVAIVSHGKLMLEETVDAIKENHKYIHVAWNGEAPAIEQFENMTLMESSGKEMTFYTDSYTPEMNTLFEKYQPKQFSVDAMSLEEVFVQTVKPKREV